MDIAAALIGDRDIEVEVVGIRPGEKVHEILVSAEEATRTVQRGDYYVIKAMLPELQRGPEEEFPLTEEYSSGSDVQSFESTETLLRDRRLTVEDITGPDKELLR